MTVPEVPLRFKKASGSGQDTSCVELAHTLLAIRDSKNPNGPVLKVAATHLVAALKPGGQFDR